MRSDGASKDLRSRLQRGEIVVIATGHVTEDHTHIVGEDGNEGELLHDDE